MKAARLKDVYPGIRLIDTNEIPVNDEPHRGVCEEPDKRKKE